MACLRYGNFDDLMQLLIIYRYYQLLVPLLLGDTTNANYWSPLLLCDTTNANYWSHYSCVILVMPTIGPIIIVWYY